MKAEDARKLRDDAHTLDNDDVRALLAGWHAAIQTAATQGRSSTTEEHVTKPSKPIGPQEHHACAAKLTADGFAVRLVPLNGRNIVEVSW